MRIVFIGPPGVGKGTQSKRLAADLNIAHLSSGDMLRQASKEKTELGMQSDQYMSTGRLVPDELMLELISRRLESIATKAGYLLDGFPRNLGQARSLDELLAQRQSSLDVVLELTADTDELVKRLSTRGRDDDRPEIVRKRLEDYLRQTAPLCDYYRRQGLLRSIDGQGTPDEVFERIKSVLGKVVPT